MSLATYTPVHKNNTQMRLCIILYFSLLPNKRKRQENHSKDNVMNRFTIRAYSATKYPPTVNPYLIPAKLKSFTSVFKHLIIATDISQCGPTVITSNPLKKH